MGDFMAARAAARSGTHTLRFEDSSLVGRGKPEEAAALELRSTVVAHGGPAPVGAEAMPFSGSFTAASKIVRGYGPEDACKTAYYAARWTGAKGQVGPWGPVFAVTIPA